jgi:hypothetical protein
VKSESGDGSSPSFSHPLQVALTHNLRVLLGRAASDDLAGSDPAGMAAAEVVAAGMAAAEVVGFGALAWGLPVHGATGVALLDGDVTAISEWGRRAREHPLR